MNLKKRDLSWGLTLVLSLLLLLLSVTVWGLRRDLVAERLTFKRSSETSAAVQSGVLRAQKEALTYLGRPLVWEGLEGYGHLEGYDPKQKPRLLVLFDDLSCVSCVQKEVAFAKRVEDLAGKGSVALIIRTRDRRWAGSFVRVNQCTFPVFLAAKEDFFRQNRIHVSPLVLLVDADLRVVASFVPVPACQDWARIFHDEFIKRLTPRAS